MESELNMAKNKIVAITKRIETSTCHVVKLALLLNLLQVSFKPRVKNAPLTTRRRGKPLNGNLRGTRDVDDISTYHRDHLLCLK